MAASTYLDTLQEALRTIQRECAHHGASCGNCPLLLEEYKCGVTGENTSGVGVYKKKPQYWNIPNIRLFGEPKA